MKKIIKPGKFKKLLLLLITSTLTLSVHAVILKAPDGMNYIWKKDNVIIEGETKKEVSVEEAGFYTVEYQQNDGKLQRQTMLVTVSGSVVIIHLVGDSTVENMPGSLYPLMGWGQKLGSFFDPTRVKIDNAAKGGQSSKSFIIEGYWSRVYNVLKPGEYVIIQFGHNDATPGDRFTDPNTTYKEYLKRYINDSRAKGAIPILCTSICQSIWSGNKVINQYFPYHVIAVRELAAEMNVPLIDLNQKTKLMMEKMGEDSMNTIFMIFEPGKYSAWPDGRNDVTHLQENGAIKVAKLVVDGLSELGILSKITSIDNALLPKVTIYPNPSCSGCTINIPSQTVLKDTRMVIFDSSGRDVQHISIDKHQKSVQIDGLKGNYFYQIINSNEKIGNGVLILQ